MKHATTANAEMFKQSFREEAREILTDLESALLELNENRGDGALVGRIFRGLHTIKGSGAMFGFEDLAAFTHDLETAFDLVRNGQLETSSELIDLTLAALDEISAMLEEDPARSVGSENRERLLESVRRLSGAESSPQRDLGSEPKVDVQVEPSPAPEGPIQTWRIQFAPGPDLMRIGANPRMLLRELRELGHAKVRAGMEAVPPLEEFDAERCYVRWEIHLETRAEREAIREVFIFVEDTCELKIESVGVPASAEGMRENAAPVVDADEHARVLKESRGTPGGRRSYDKPDNATSLRIAAAKLDQLVDLVGELVTVQARLSELAGRRVDAELTAVGEEVERLTSALRESSMNMRLVPIRATFDKFRRLVHDLARDLGKNVDLTIEGAETELDKTVIEQLSDPLMHLIRNSMDHGIEPVEARVANGKAAMARIHLSAKHSGANVLISVADDGRGIDCEAVRRRAVERGLIPADADLTETQIYGLIFQPGFSTARQVTDVSGRGVGMDVVRQKVESLRGAVDVSSRNGAGTTVTLRLPLTMAIIDGLLVTVGDGSFVLPVASTLECIELTHKEIERSNGHRFATVRGQIVPYIRLREYFGLPLRGPEIDQVIFLDNGKGRVGLVVDQILGNCQAVIKSLGRVYRQVQMVAGATILGNGTVALILDPDRLIQEAAHSEDRSILSKRPRGYAQTDPPPIADTDTG
ncbi:chemotaxis protein CheA [Occallatibacter riparius]|uniref:Chemotaxis protein CheA n=1 Tax=Occallatibacter riparius TaxID=1002689 RepID=A0A9J7BIZ6_9BACT|nr:chemotaxis protein CheA [Occallatibacter riparius]UWZ82457.1 chemotaxis protein CheA [Occallatibacter riparius]